MIASAERSVCLASLAGLLRSAENVHAAMIHWHEHVPDEAREPLVRLSRRISLGKLPEDALGALDGSFGDTSRHLAVAFALYRAGGGDIAGMIDGVAAALARDAAMEESGRAAAAGARVSGRMVAVLPVAFIAVAPVIGGARFDLVGWLLLALGGGFAAIGLRWIERLVPRAAPPPTAGEMIAELSGSMLSGGAELAQTLNLVALHGPPAAAEPLLRARRMVELGSSWTSALQRSRDESLRALAPIVSRSQSMGLPIAGAMEAFATQRRSARERDYEAQLRRAPVRMVVPLALCLLPAFLVSALAPFIRNLV